MLFRVNFGNALSEADRDASRCPDQGDRAPPNKSGPFGVGCFLDRARGMLRTSQAADLKSVPVEETRVDVVAATKQKVLVLRVRNSELLL
jgi:hypothetical protein